MIINQFYGVEGNGLPGNDDYGTMSAWLIFASLGFYPLPSTDKYIIGSPLIHYGRISRKFGEEDIRTLKIRVTNNSNKNTYVESVWVERKKVDGSVLEYGMIGEGYMEFRMR